MNRTAIEWVDWTWNPVTGCRNGCPFCYARRLAETRLRGRAGYPADDPFRPTFHPGRLAEVSQPRAGERVFVVSMGDLFSEGVEPAWAHAVLAATQRRPDVYWIVLTKRPDRMVDVVPRDPNAGGDRLCVPAKNGAVVLGGNVAFGVSLARVRDAWRVAALRLAVPSAYVRWASAEPLHEDLFGDPEAGEALAALDWVVVGAETGARPGRVAPRRPWVRHAWARRGDVAMFFKNNIEGLLPAGYARWRQWPARLGGGDGADAARERGTLAWHVRRAAGPASAHKHTHNNDNAKLG